MKYLTAVRHAKSSWKDPELSDIDRPLNKRGYRSAELMGKYLNKLKHHPELIISSPAKRAYDTSVIISREVGYPADDIQIDDRLYFQGESGIIACLKELPDHYTSVFIFGHEPTMSSFTYAMTRREVDKFSTAAVFAMKTNITTWQNFGQQAVEKVFFIKPKMLKAEDLG